MECLLLNVFFISNFYVINIYMIFLYKNIIIERIIKKINQITSTLKTYNLSDNIKEETF